MGDRRQLGKFEVLTRLSTGGMSEIYLAHQTGLGGFRKLVVLKTILPDISGEEDFVSMFLDEARITASFNHPNIAQVYELDVSGGTLFMAMEFVQGCTLVEMARACLHAKESIPIGFSLMSVRDTALALHYAHSFTDPRGRKQIVIHRDVAEKNIMVTHEGVTKLLDFGIAKALGRSNRTTVGMVKGTSGYMSPEQIKGEPLDGRSDIFSLGVVAHECLTGMRLFFGKSAHEGMLAVLREDIPAPSKLNPEVSRDVDAVVLKALQRNREDRYSTALEFARALEKASPGLIWHPEQTAELVTRHFQTHRIETRRLIEMATSPTESSGEISINNVLAQVRASSKSGPDPRASVSPRPQAIEAPKRSLPPTSTPPVPPPSGMATVGARPARPSTEAPTVSARPSLRPTVVERNEEAPPQPPRNPPLPESSGPRYDDGDYERDGEAKTIPAFVPPAEFKALRAQLKKKHTQSETAPAPRHNDSESETDPDRPRVKMPKRKVEDLTHVINTNPALPDRKQAVSELLPARDADDTNAGVEIDLTPRSTARKEGSSASDTAEPSQPVPLPSFATMGPEGESQPAVKAQSNAPIIFMLIVTLLLTIVGIFYLLEIAPFGPSFPVRALPTSPEPKPRAPGS
jgi:serine/threonine protein kinase